MIYLTSDLHLGHDKTFLYAPRGFENITDMNEAVVQNWNSIIEDDDIVYVLGDLILGDIDSGLNYLKQLKGHIIVIIGNHDTDNKIQRYLDLSNVEQVLYAYRFKYGKRHYWLSHYPTYCGNVDDRPFWNLCGHTHSKEIFQKDFPFTYNVALDAHNNFPVSIEQIHSDIIEYRQHGKRSDYGRKE